VLKIHEWALPKTPEEERDERYLEEDGGNNDGGSGNGEEGEDEEGRGEPSRVEMGAFNGALYGFAGAAILMAGLFASFQVRAQGSRLHEVKTLDDEYLAHVPMSPHFLVLAPTS